MAALETGSIPFDKKLFCGSKLIERGKVSTIFIYIEFFYGKHYFFECSDTTFIPQSPPMP